MGMNITTNDQNQQVPMTGTNTGQTSWSEFLVKQIKAECANTHTCQATLDISGSPIDFQCGSSNIQGNLTGMDVDGLTKSGSDIAN